MRPDVQRLAGVLLEVHPLDPDPERLTVDVHVDVAVHAERLVVLRGLEVFRHVGVEVVCPGHPAPGRDRAVEREADPDRGLDRGAVGDRQRPGQAETDRADLGVGLRAETGRAAAEHLRPRAELDVRLQADHRLEAGDGVLIGRQHGRTHKGELQVGCASGPTTTSLVGSPDNSPPGFALPRQLRARAGRRCRPPTPARPRRDTSGRRPLSGPSPGSRPEVPRRARTARRSPGRRRGSSGS